MPLTHTHNSRARAPTPAAAHARTPCPHSALPSIPTRCASLLMASLSCQSFSFSLSSKKNGFFGRPCKSFKKKRKEKENKEKKPRKGNMGSHKGPGATAPEGSATTCRVLPASFGVPAMGPLDGQKPEGHRSSAPPARWERAAQGRKKRQAYLSIGGRRCQVWCCPAERTCGADTESQLLSTLKRENEAGCGGTPL